LRIPFHGEVLLALSSSIYAYGGYPFLAGMAGEIARRRPGMMTLVGTAITAAFFYSAAAVLTGGGGPSSGSSRR